MDIMPEFNNLLDKDELLATCFSSTNVIFLILMGTHHEKLKRKQNRLLKRFTSLPKFYSVLNIKTLTCPVEGIKLLWYLACSKVLITSSLSRNHKSHT